MVARMGRGSPAARKREKSDAADGGRKPRIRAYPNNPIWLATMVAQARCSMAS
jgi:hypothetical protein